MKDLFCGASWKPQSRHFTPLLQPVNHLPERGLSHVNPPPSYKDVVLMETFTEVICRLRLYAGTGGPERSD